MSRRLLRGHPAVLHGTPGARFDPVDPTTDKLGALGVLTGINRRSRRSSHIASAK
jgi:hypothetical protein